MKRRIFFILLAIFVVTTPAWAHKVNLFCYVEGDRLYGESYFSGGRAAQNAKVEVYDDTNDSLMATIVTDEAGKFSLTLEKMVPLKVILYAGQGHKTEFFITPENNGLPKTETTIIEKKTQISDIEPIIDRKLKPLQERIILLEKKISEPSFATILGGIGWIIGTFALFYFWKRKNAS
ncbi:hypothetical protein ACFL2Y_01515 [Candidatus Omnitrophota bacterium]